MPTTYSLAWYNLENLFDHQHAPRPDYLKKQLARELTDWSAAVRDKKIAQLASVIRRMNDGAGPDLLGVCEVENAAVLRRLVDAIGLPGRQYAIAHHDTSDKRGIDVAFIYDAARLTPEPGGMFSYEVLKRSATRDLWQVNFETAAGNVLVAIGNHWPARSAGKYESEPYRILAAETLSYWLTRIHELRAADAERMGVVVMGDFNDAPFDRSMVDYALSSSSAASVRSARTPKLLNLMWPALGEGGFTYYFGGEGQVLDQFLLDSWMLRRGGPFTVVPGSVEVVRFDDMAKGRDKYPRRFGRSAKGLDEQGYSDHFPIALTLQEG